MSEPLTTLSIQNGVAEVTLNRPGKRNALTRQLIAELAASVSAAAADRSTRMVFLSGNGPAFCAGMDLDEMQQRAQQPEAREEWETDAREYRDLLLTILQLDVPSVAVVQGPAIAGGFGLALACDLVVASTQARFALPEPKRGISPAVVAPLLIHRIGAGASMPLLLTGQVWNGEQAFAAGLCHFLAPPEALDETRAEVQASILAGAPQALAMTKQLVRSFSEPALIFELEAGRKVSAAARQTSEAREGLNAFKENRPPAWDRGRSE